MFTGLVEEIGIISLIENNGKSLYLTVECSKVLEGLKVGDSIAINGACQTVTELTTGSFKVFASYETINSTAFSLLKCGSEVNLERTLRLSDRLDGHIVSGHVDGTAVIKKIETIAESTKFTFEAAPNLTKQIVKKGSVAIDGISLTISDISGTVFSVVVIPHTISATNLRHRKAGDRVNIETDMLSKYIEKYLSSNDNNTNVNYDFLERNGFV